MTDFRPVLDPKVETRVVRPFRSRAWGWTFTLAAWLVIAVPFYTFFGFPVLIEVRIAHLEEEKQAERIDRPPEVASSPASSASSGRISEEQRNRIGDVLSETPNSGTPRVDYDLAYLKRLRAEWHPSLFVVYVVFPLAIFLFRLGRRLRALDALQLFNRDSRPPVLYLRSFKDDSSEVARATENLSSLELATEEDKLVKRLRPIGPVIGIGKPEERLTHSGAARLYVSHTEWQHVAGLLMGQAQLVVLRAGLSNGLFWELEHIRKSFPPEKLALYVPGSYGLKVPKAKANLSYPLFRIEAEKHLGSPLPGDLNGRQLIVFDSEWKAQPASKLNGHEAQFAHGNIHDSIKNDFSELAAAIKRRPTDSTYQPHTVLASLQVLHAHSIAPPRFSPSPWVYPLVLACAVVLLLYPSTVMGFLTGSDLLWPEHPGAVATLLELSGVSLAALGAAFWFHIVNPSSRLLSNLAFAAVFLLEIVLVAVRQITFR